MTDISKILFEMGVCVRIFKKENICRGLCLTL